MLATVSWTWLIVGLLLGVVFRDQIAALPLVRSLPL